MAKPFDNFYANVPSDQRLAVECIDDRGYGIDRPAVRVAAGPFGLAKDSLAALSAAGNIEALSTPVGVMAASIANDLYVNGFEASTHIECAAELGAVAVAEHITDEAAAKETRDRAGVILGRDISDREMSGIQRYYDQFVGDDSYYTSPEIEAAHMRTHGVHRSDLAFDEHAGSTLVSNHRSGTYFKTQEAYAVGQPYYSLDMWAAHSYAEALSHRLPVSRDAIMASMAIRHAAITQLLPNPSGGHGVDIELRAA